ncbi:dimethyl sulfoxide reductase anchor subunit family protein [Symbiobacterium terraclitae]|uniref:dimethyl sulfoxide reductase anchor subunit family protein n=1 Tax=Symbiobacterium terraclitae TaxID=557451 RepID=UPI0035B513A3
MAEWLHEAQYSLVLFTVLMQVAIGALWVLAAADLQEAQSPDPDRARLTRLGSAILLPVAAVGMLFSTTHLGRPMLAMRALRHWETSWMSREIWMTGLFFGLIALYTLLWWWRPEVGKARRAVGVMGALAGAATILSQAMIYMIPGRPMWNHWSTLALFFGSALMLGPLAVASVQELGGAARGGRAKADQRPGAGREQRPDAGTGRRIMAGGAPEVAHRHLALTLLAAVAVYGIGLAGRLRYLADGAAAALATPGAAGKAAVGSETVRTALLLGQQVVAANGVLLGLEVALAIGVPAALAAVLWLTQRRGGGSGPRRGLLGAGLALTLVGHLAGRALFYLSGQPWF